MAFKQLILPTKTSTFVIYFILLFIIFGLSLGFLRPCFGCPPLTLKEKLKVLSFSAFILVLAIVLVVRMIYLKVKK